MQEIQVTPSAGNAPAAVRSFVETLSRAQGCRVVLSNEKSGYHAYLPCPECLHTHGKNELQDPKYAINLSLYLQIGKFADTHSGPLTGMVSALKKSGAAGRSEFGSSVCMRTRQSRNPHRFSVSDLLTMGTVTHRFPDIRTQAAVVGQAGSGDREEHWEEDPESGVLCPPPPGKVTPVTDLPADHPAVEYLTGRGYDLRRLWDQFRCGWCSEEYPEGTNGVFYRRMPDGWKDTPQHRIIFKSMIRGVPMTWQARYIEKVGADGLSKLMLHPYRMEGPATYHWSVTHVRPNQAGVWMPVSPFDQVDEQGSLKFRPSKYRTAKYSSREMMGWDAATDRADKDPSDIKWCVLCEGPLDAARVGPGGIALIGSSISPDNAARVSSAFHLVFTAFDEDKAGRGATERVGAMLMNARGRSNLTQLVVPIPVPSGKDIGEMSQEAFDSLFTRTLKQSLRSF